MIRSVCNGWPLYHARERLLCESRRPARQPVTPVTPVTLHTTRGLFRIMHAIHGPFCYRIKSLTRNTCNILFLSGIGLLELRKWISKFLRARYKAEVA